jgi:hypothetical protein
MASASTLKAIARVIDALEEAEKNEDIYLTGTVELVDAEGKRVASELFLNGDTVHELNIGGEM